MDIPLPSISNLKHDELMCSRIKALQVLARHDRSIEDTVAELKVPTEECDYIHPVIFTPGLCICIYTPDVYMTR